MAKSIPRFKIGRNGGKVLDGSISQVGKQAPTSKPEARVTRVRPNQDANPLVNMIDPIEAERIRNEIYDRAIAKLEDKKAILDAEKAAREAAEKAKLDEMTQLDLFDASEDSEMQEE